MLYKAKLITRCGCKQMLTLPVMEGEDPPLEFNIPLRPVEVADESFITIIQALTHTPFRTFMRTAEERQLGNCLIITYREKPE